MRKSASFSSIIILFFLQTSCFYSQVVAAQMASTVVSTVDVKDVVFVSILPQQFFVQYLANDFLQVKVLVKPGQSPETFDPSPKQMTQLAKAKIYITLGLRFEQQLLKRIADNNKQLQIINSQSKKHQLAGDPHTWLDPLLVKQQLAIIYHGLEKSYPQFKPKLQQRFNQFNEQLRQLDKSINELFNPIVSISKQQRKNNFVVFHPALSYFARRYQLNQIAIEKQGKNSSAKHLADLLADLKLKSVKTILVETQFSPKQAQSIADVLNAQLLEIDPLAANWFENMRLISKLVHASLF